MNFQKSMRIDPRKRWNKLYNRTSPFKVIRQSLLAEISEKIIKLQNLPPTKEPTKLRTVVGHIRKNKQASRTMIYHRCPLKLQNDDRYFPLIWNKPSSSDVIDEVSGQALCHISLLCRDVICECNKCTLGCHILEYFCDVCKLKLCVKPSVVPIGNLSGSLAEDCQLPIFYVQNDENDAVKKVSDIDVMRDTGCTVGFDKRECNIMATIEIENSPPGYLQLRDIETGMVLYLPQMESIGHIEPIKMSPIGIWLQVLWMGILFNMAQL